MDMLRDAISEIDYNVRQALVKGWCIPESVREKFINLSPYGKDQEAWFNDLFQEFCKEVTFPEHWTVVEQVRVFGDLLFNYRQWGEFHEVK